MFPSSPEPVGTLVFTEDGKRTKLTMTIECATNKPSEAVKLFLKSVGVPAFFIAVMPLMPFWSKLKATALTLLYDRAIVGENQRGKPLRGTGHGRWKKPYIDDSREPVAGERIAERAARNTRRHIC